jgi:hypothetical protein
MTMPWYENAAAHFLAGITISFGDRLFSKNAKRHTEERVSRKLDQVQALEYLVDQKDTETPEYFKNIMKAREYFMERGKSVKSGEMTRAEKVAEKVSFYRSYERLNNLSVKSKLAAAFGLELIADATVAVSQIVEGVGNAITALANTLYQGPFMFLGLETGRGILYLKDLWKTKDEKELDDVAKELTKDKKLLETVRNYSRTRNLKVYEPKALPDVGHEKTLKPQVSSAEIGARAQEKLAYVTDGVKDAVGGFLAARRARIEAMKKQEEDARKAEKDAKSKDFRDSLNDY